MTIAIQSSGALLDLPTDVKLNIETSSPIFSTEASMSLPVSLPLTDHNRRVLQFPDRLDIYDNTENAIRTIPDTLVIVTQGSWQQRATLCVSACSETAIEVTLYFKESNIWSKLDDITLPQAMAGLHYGNIPPTASDIATYRQQLFANLTADMDDYSYIIDEEENDTSQGSTYEDWKDMYEDRAEWFKTREFAIAPVYTEDGWLNKLGQNGPPRHYLVPTTSYLYITAFLRLDFVLHHIFEMAGFTLNIDFSGLPDSTPSSFLEEQWHSIFILNNTMDALYPGCMYYSALVPDISCKVFLLAVQAQFGCTFIYQLDGTYKMQFIQGILTDLSKASSILCHDRQISFDASPDYQPANEITKQDQAKVQMVTMPLSAQSPTLVPSHDAWDRYPQMNVISLDGACQRTTTTTTDGEDDSKNTKCPLIFAAMDFTFAWYSSTDDHGNPYTEKVYYPCLRKPYFEYFRRGGTFDRQDVEFLRFTETNPDSLYQLLNSAYDTIAESCDRVTIQTTITTQQLSQFDFTRPVLIQGRLCWPAKLQYELQNRDKQQVTMECIAPRKTL